MPEQTPQQDDLSAPTMHSEWTRPCVLRVLQTSRITSQSRASGILLEGHLMSKGHFASRFAQHLHRVDIANVKARSIYLLGT